MENWKGNWINLGHTMSETINSVEEESKQDRWRSCLIEIIETFLIALVLYLTVNAFLPRILVVGKSMEPSLHHNDRVIVNRLAYHLGEVDRGDVVVFKRDDGRDYIKRVIGLPGDTIEVLGGHVYVNGLMIAEPYIMMPVIRDKPVDTIPLGMVFVMGDNRNDSSDSRSWGPISVDDLTGKALLVYWPPANFGAVEHYNPIPKDP